MLSSRGKDLTMNLPVKLQTGERVDMLVRRHPVYVILKVVAAVIITVLAILLVQWLSSLIGLSGLGTILTIAAVVVALGYLAIVLYRYFNDLWLITNQRVIDSTKPTPFRHEVASTDLVNVQDINILKSGIFATIFNFGDVVCQTASMGGIFSFRGVPDPTHLLERIDQLRDESRAAIRGQTSI